MAFFSFKFIGGVLFRFNLQMAFDFCPFDTSFDQTPHSHWKFWFLISMTFTTEFEINHQFICIYGPLTQMHTVDFETGEDVIV